MKNPTRSGDSSSQRHIATLKVVSRLLGHELKSQAAGKPISMSRDEVTEIQTFLGSVDIRLVVIARDLAHYQVLYREKLLTLPHIADIEALMHVSLVKSDETVPL
mgnify:CR=1 FL=1